MNYISYIPLLMILALLSSCTEKEDNIIKDIIENDTSIVSLHGPLQVSGNNIVNQYGNPISLAGNSFYWSNDNWGGERYYTKGAVSWLKKDWKATIVRAAMGVEDPGGYIDNKQGNKNRIKIIIDAAIEEGVYVIIDWHSHNAQDYQDEAIEFFQEMAILYGETNNVIYELYNEPLDVSWSNTIKPYSLAVISAIRAIDPDNLIIVGTPEWSQRIDLAAADPITEFSNIAYSLHFYTEFHHQLLRDRASAALESGIPIFVTEWGSIGYSLVDSEANDWMTWCFTNKISHCNWAVNDKEEEWSILLPNANYSGGWGDSDLTDAGKLAKNIISNWPNSDF